MTTTTPTVPSPNADSNARRVVALDVARGIAIIGTLGTNVWIFTDPQGMIGYLENAGTEALPIRLLQTLAQGKFLGLLSLMFGVGLAITQASVLRRGRPWPGRYWRRALLLFIDGAVHFVVIAEFDVLMGYAMVSLIVSALLLLGSRPRRRWLVGCALIHTAVVILLVAGWGAAGSTPQEARPIETVYANGSFVDLMRFRLDHVALFRAETVLVIPMTIALFLAGAHLYQRGLFAPDAARLRRRLMVIGAVAAVVDLAVAVIAARLGFGGPAVLVGRYLVAPFVALGILAAIAGWYCRREPGLLGRAFRRVGATALSCYVLQNILASILCYGWGFGLAQRYGGDHRLVFTVAVYAAVALCVVMAAQLWTRRFARGPIESVMRALR